MKKGMINLTIVLLVLFGLSLSMYFLYDGAFFAISISIGTTLYHFAMRLAVGGVVNGILHNKVNIHNKWFVVGKGEQRFYDWLGVKRWKGKMPTYDPSAFDISIHSVSEIAQAGCQAEIVHEIIVLFSFLPLIVIVWFGEPLVFILTSVFAALFDSVFIVMQRFNRPRLLKIIQRQNNK